MLLLAVFLHWRCLTCCRLQILLGPDMLIPIDFKDATGNTLFHIACQNGNKRIAKLCLRRGAAINAQNVSFGGLLA